MTLDEFKYFGYLQRVRNAVDFCTRKCVEEAKMDVAKTLKCIAMCLEAEARREDPKQN